MLERISWPLAGVVAAGVLAIGSGWFWWVGDVGADPHRPVEVTHTVVYSVAGAGSAEVSWDDTTGGIITRSAARLPWSSQPLTVDRSGFVTRLDAAGHGTGTVRCSITIDGQLVVEATGTGGNRAACSYVFSAP